VSAPSLEIPRRELAFREERDGFSLTLKRNCSTTPTGLLRVFAALAVVVLAIGAGFAAAGAWLVLPFAGLEVLLLGGAFVLYARRAADYERLQLEGGRLVLERGEAERRERYAMQAHEARLRVEKQAGCGARIWLRSGLRAGEEELEIGRHLDAQARLELAAELKRRLQI
jgi:uncharacterized membrane protein